MFEVVIRGFKTQEEAEEFVDAYEGGVEQTMYDVSCITIGPKFPCTTVMGKDWKKIEGNKVIIEVE